MGIVVDARSIALDAAYCITDYCLKEGAITWPLVTVSHLYRRRIHREINKFRGEGSKINRLLFILRP